MLRVEQIFVWVFLSILLCGVGLVTYWLFFDVKIPVRGISVETINSKGLPTKVFKGGDTMLVSRETCYYEDTILFYTRSLVNTKNKISYVMPSGPLEVQEGCRKSILHTRIPEYIEPGEYDYIVTIHYENNPFIEGYTQLPSPRITIKD
jgi:hypothetical protein